MPARRLGLASPSSKQKPAVGPFCALELLPCGETELLFIEPPAIDPELLLVLEVAPPWEVGGAAPYVREPWNVREPAVVVPDAAFPP
jgi:hypothetical protein